MSDGAGLPVTGRCLCGAVRYGATVKSLHADACHCGMCRRWSAGPMFAVDCGDSVRFDDEAALGIYRSSEWAERGFCKACGTSMFYRLAEKPFYAVSAETLDAKDDLVFTKEIFIEEQPAYYAFANETEKMTGAQVMAAFGGSDDPE